MITETYNGHYYIVAYVSTANVSWVQAAYLADQLGGYLACPNDDDDKYFWHFDITDSAQSEQNGISIGPFLGGFQPDGSIEPNGNWRWLDGSAITDSEENASGYTNWSEDLYCSSDLDSTVCPNSISDSTNTDLDYRINDQPNDSGDGQPVMGFGEINKLVATWRDYMGDVAEYGAETIPGSSYGFMKTISECKSLAVS